MEVEPYTPAHHFEGGKEDPLFRTKPQRIALELVVAAVEGGIPFRAVVGEILYGEHRGFRKGLEEKRIPYVLALKPSYAWYRPITEPGAVEEIAQLAPWEGPDDPGEWVKLTRTFRDGHTEQWWALEAESRPFGKDEEFLRLGTLPSTLRSGDPASLAASVLCFDLLLVGEHRPPLGGRCAPRGGSRRGERLDLHFLRGGAGKKGDSKPPASSVLARGTQEGEEVAGAVRNAHARYWKAYSEKPPPKELRRLLEWVFLGNGLYLYVH